MRSRTVLLACAVLAAALLSPVLARSWSAGPTGTCTDSSGRNFPCGESSPPSPEPREPRGGPAEPEPPSAQSQATTLYNQGVDLDRAGRFAEAEAAYRQAIALYPYDGAFFNNLGAVLHAQGRYEEALEAWRQAVALGNAKARDNLDRTARWLEQRKQTAAANQLVQQAQGLWDRRDYANAAAVWRRILAMFPDHVAGWQELARCLELQALQVDAADPRREALRKEALEAVRTALRLDPNNLFSYKVTAMVLDDLGRREEAVVFLKEALRRGETKANVLAALRELMSYNTAADSVHYLKAVAELDPADAAARDKLASALRATAKNERLPAKERLAAASDLVAQAPNDPGNQALLGATLIAAGQADKGRKAFAEAFRLAPGDFNLRAELGYSLDAAGDHAGAAAAYRQSIGLAGPEVEVSERAALHGLLGLSLEGSNDLFGADAAIRQGIALDPQEPVLHTIYAQFLERRSSFFAAEREYRTAAALAPDDPKRAAALADFQQRQGLAAQQAGRPEAAERLLAAAQEADPDNAELGAALAKATQETARVVRQGLGERAAALSATLASLGFTAPAATGGRPLDFSAWTVRPQGGEDTSAGKQATAAQASGQAAGIALDPERAAAKAGLNFDTHGIPLARIPTASAKAPTPDVPPHLRTDPILAALLLRHTDLAARLEAQQRRTAAAEAARGASPEAQVAATRERLAEDKLQQALNFILFSESERVAELQRKAANTGQNSGGGHAQ
jgi:Flp pilus assembly protein TadD